MKALKVGVPLLVSLSFDKLRASGPLMVSLSNHKLRASGLLSSLVAGWAATL